MTRTVTIEKKILEKNDTVAARVRARFQSENLAVVNIMSSPGAGKTTLLAETVKRFSTSIRTGVIVGDIATDHDAKIIEAAGAHWVVQINTAGRCHLEAGMIEQAVAEMSKGLDLLIIENIGNLVCPAGFDLGEDYRVMLAALTEGTDKPKKYPGMYRACSHLVINKIDLESALGVSGESFEHEALQTNPKLEIFRTSAKNGDGLDRWCDWLRSVVNEKG